MAGKICSHAGRRRAVRTEPLEPRLMFAVHNDSFDVTDLTELRSDPTYSAITGTGITIAVLDTGIDALNPDFTGKVLAFYNAVEDAVPTTISASPSAAPSTTTATARTSRASPLPAIPTSASPTEPIWSTSR
jgi:subtilisin family serine protease